MFSRIFPPQKSQMAANSRNSPLPAWILLPVFARRRGRGAGHLGNGKSVPRARHSAGRRALGGMVVRADAARRRRHHRPDRRRRPLCGAAGRIGSGALGDSAVAAEQMRQVLIDADALAVDHRSREAETRLHHAGRGFFTQRFRTTVDKLVGVFQSAAEEIQVTAADLGARNKDMCANAPRMRSMPPRRRAATSPRSPTPRAGSCADCAVHHRSRRRQGRHCAHHNRPRAHRPHRAQPRRRRRTHRHGGEIDRGDRLANVAAGAQRHHRGGARRRRRPRFCRGRLGSQNPGAADRQSHRRYQRPDPRHPARGERNGGCHRRRVVERDHHERGQPAIDRHPRSPGHRDRPHRQPRRAGRRRRRRRVAGNLYHRQQRRGGRQRRTDDRRGSARPLEMAGGRDLELFLRPRARLDQDRICIRCPAP